MRHKKLTTYTDNTPVFELREPSLDECGYCELPITMEDEVICETRQTGYNCKDQVWALHVACRAAIKPLRTEGFMNVLTGNILGDDIHHITYSVGTDILAKVAAADNRQKLKLHNYEARMLERY